MSTKLHFKTNTLLKNLVGKDLINDDNIAIVELVKNAYDAGSNSVAIRFEDIGNAESSRLIVADKGSGMGSSDIQDKWLNIAYSEKKTAPRNHGASFAGNKGIGRFSCDRLGEHLDLITRRRGGSLFHLKIAWPDFEIEGDKDLVIQKIDVILNEISTKQAKAISGMEMPAAGTILVISKLRSLWDREKLLVLKRTLEKFLNPNQLFQKQVFDIELEVPELAKKEATAAYTDRVTGTVKNQIFENLKFNSTFVRVRIDRHGKVLDTELSHDGESVLRIKEKNPYNFLKNVSSTIYYLNPYKKAYFKRQTGLRSIDFGSIFLFLNGFRIAPYGDRGDDWLGLDVRKTQGTSRYLGSRDLIGRVEIIDDEESFKPISSREGLKKTAAFVELKEEFILEAVRRLEKFVVDGLNWDSIPDHLRDEVRADTGMDWTKTVEHYSESWDKKRERIALTIMTFIGSSQDRIISFWFNPALLEGVMDQRAEEVEQLLTTIDGFDSGQVEPGLKKGIARLRSLVDQRERESRAARAEAANLRLVVAEHSKKLGKLEKEAETFQAQTLFLQSLASLEAKNLVAFHHEICLNSSIIDNHMGKAMKALRGLPGTDPALQELEKIALANKRIMAIAQFATKANFKSSSTKELTDIPAFFEQYINNVAREFIATGLLLNVSNLVTEPFEVKVRRIELSILIDNIISNANKAQARKLDIAISKIAANSISISFVDDGNGLSDAIRDPKEIFELGVTTTKGSGLGLYHCRQIVQTLGGTIQAIPVSPKGLELRVIVTR